LARYLSGGPISGRRLLAHEDGQVTFLARSKNKQTGNRPRPFTLSGVEFVRRWSLHILPKGFTKVRIYGGFSTRHRASYLERCRTLLRVPADDEHDEQCGDDLREETEKSAPTCPHCQCEMVCLQASQRPSWRDLFASPATCPWWYSTMGYRPPVGRVRGAEP
jgi:hypothetical protein